MLFSDCVFEETAQTDRQIGSIEFSVKKERLLTLVEIEVLDNNRVHHRLLVSLLPNKTLNIYLYFWNQIKLAFLVQSRLLLLLLLLRLLLSLLLSRALLSRSKSIIANVLVVSYDNFLVMARFFRFKLF